MIPIAQCTLLIIRVSKQASLRIIPTTIGEMMAISNFKPLTIVSLFPDMTSHWLETIDWSTGVSASLHHGNLTVKSQQSSGFGYQSSILDTTDNTK